MPPQSLYICNEFRINIYFWVVLWLIVYQIFLTASVLEFWLVIFNKRMIKLQPKNSSKFFTLKQTLPYMATKPFICCSNSYSGKGWKFAAFVKVGYPSFCNHCSISWCENKFTLHSVKRKQSRQCMQVIAQESLYIPFALYTLENRYVQIA